MIIPDFRQPMPRYIKETDISGDKWFQCVDVLKQIIKQNEPKFEFTDAIADVYRNLLLYFHGNANSKYDLNKGLFIYGKPGCGKSLILQYVFKQYTFNLGVNSYRVVQSVDIVRDIQKNGLNCIEKYVLSDSGNPITLYIDDFGAGNLKINHFGTVVDIFSELIINRYPYFSRYGTLTHISSNIVPEKFKDVFDDRIASRMAQMCNIINIQSVDYRRKTT